eukprot:3014967-Ditylum_brightwellii.AAC.1
MSYASKYVKTTMSIGLVRAVDRYGNLFGSGTEVSVPINTCYSPLPQIFPCAIVSDEQATLSL